jgi:hypothetical protein
MSLQTSLIVLGSGTADSPQPELFSAQTRASVRYGDPAAWITAAAALRATRGLGNLLAQSLHETGTVVVSDQGPDATMAALQAATSTGFSSPLRFAAASPGSMVGVVCIAIGFRGPTLYLAMRPEEGIPVALEMCAGWLARGVARGMVVATFKSDRPGTGSARAVLLASSDAPEIENSFTPSVAGWLIQDRNAPCP